MLNRKVLFLVLFVLIPLVSSAQTFPAPTPEQSRITAKDLRENISVIILPENPGPRTETKITIESFAINLDQAGISWTLNGKRVQEGIGKRSLTFTTGDIGTQSIITVDISPQNFPLFTKKFIITPATVDLIWEAQTYSPPFYRGKSYFTDQAQVTVVAVPHIANPNGSEIPPGSLNYKWKWGTNVLPQFSGRGIQSMEFSGSYLGGDELVEVEISSPDGSITSKGSLTLKPVKPSILVYENNPLYGVLFNRAITREFNLRENEVSITVVPYSFSYSPDINNLDIGWLVNGKNMSDSGSGDTITLRNDSASAGRSRVEVQIKNRIEKFQTGDSSFYVNFNSN